MKKKLMKYLIKKKQKILIKNLILLKIRSAIKKQAEKVVEMYNISKELDLYKSYEEEINEIKRLILLKNHIQKIKPIKEKNIKKKNQIVY